jgi:hypothetical protein
VEPASPGSDELLPDGKRLEAEPPDGVGIEAVAPASPGIEGLPGEDDVEPGIEGPPADDEEDELLGIEGPPDDEDDGELLGIDGLLEEEEDEDGDELGIDGELLLELCCCVVSQPTRISASADAPSQWITRTDRPEECCVFMMASESIGSVAPAFHKRRPLSSYCCPHCADQALSSDFGTSRSTPAAATSARDGIIGGHFRGQT